MSTLENLVDVEVKNWTWVEDKDNLGQLTGYHTVDTTTLVHNAEAVAVMYSYKDHQLDGEEPATEMTPDTYRTMWLLPSLDGGLVLNITANKKLDDGTMVMDNGREQSFSLTKAQVAVLRRYLDEHHQHS